jgi:hypothetical protein
VLVPRRYVEGTFRLAQTLFTLAQAEAETETESEAKNKEPAPLSAPAHAGAAAGAGRRGGSRQRRYLLAVEARDAFAAGMGLDPDLTEMREGFEHAWALVQLLEEATAGEQAATLSTVEAAADTSVAGPEIKQEAIAGGESSDKEKQNSEETINEETEAGTNNCEVTAGESGESIVAFMTSSLSSSSVVSNVSVNASKSAAKKKAKKIRAKAGVEAAAAAAAPSNSGGSGADADTSSPTPTSMSATAKRAMEVVGASPLRSTASRVETPVASFPSFPPVVPFEALTCDDDLNPHRATLRASVREHGCVGVRLPSKLCSGGSRSSVSGCGSPSMSPLGVLGEAGAAAAAFFALDSATKARHKPVGYLSRHGYRTPRDAAGSAMRNSGGLSVGVPGGSDDGGIGGDSSSAAKPPAVMKDEEHRECFIIGNEFEEDYPWPGKVPHFRQRVLDAHVTLRRTATKAGDALMSGLVEMDDAFDALAHEIGMSSMFTRTTFVYHPAPGDSSVEGSSGGGDGSGSNSTATLAAAVAAAAAAVVGHAGATREPSLVTLIPCVGSSGEGGGVGSTVTRLQLPGRAPMEWPPRSADASSDDYRDVVLVIAGEWLSKITGGAYPAPAVSHERWVEAREGRVAGTGGACLHATFRA